MATLYVWEFSEVAVRNGTHFPQTPGIVQQIPVPEDTNSTNSAQFNAATAFVLISSDIICQIAIGANPTATMSNFRIPAGVVLPFGVNAGDRIAVTSGA